VLRVFGVDVVFKECFLLDVDGGLFVVPPGFHVRRDERFCEALLERWFCGCSGVCSLPRAAWEAFGYYFHVVTLQTLQAVLQLCGVTLFRRTALQL